MLRYLIKTLLQMNLFTDTVRHPANGTDPLFNVTLPIFNSSLLDWGNFSGFNGESPPTSLTCPLHRVDPGSLLRNHFTRRRSL